MAEGKEWFEEQDKTRRAEFKIRNVFSESTLFCTFQLRFPFREPSVVSLGKNDPGPIKATPNYND